MSDFRILPLTWIRTCCCFSCKRLLLGLLQVGENAFVPNVGGGVDAKFAAGQHHQQNGRDTDQREVMLEGETVRPLRTRAVAAWCSAYTAAELAAVARKGA